MTEPKKDKHFQSDGVEMFGGALATTSDQVGAQPLAALERHLTIKSGF